MILMGMKFNVPPDPPHRDGCTKPTYGLNMAAVIHWDHRPDGTEDCRRVAEELNLGTVWFAECYEIVPGKQILREYRCRFRNGEWGEWREVG